MKLKLFLRTIVFSFLAMIFTAGCSSAPKRTMLVTDTYTLAWSKLETANNSLLAGEVLKARALLSESYTLAQTIDNAPLLCKITLSGIVCKILAEQQSTALNQEQSAENHTFMEESLDSLLKNARTFATISEDKDFLLSLCSVYGVRIQLEDEKMSKTTLSQSDKNNLLSTLNSAEKSVSKEPYYAGYLKRTQGDLLMNLKDYSSAEKAYLEAAALHTKNRYVYEIGLDYYSAARACSLGGDKTGAVRAIENALKYDRDAENSLALAADYLAYSKILLKGTPTAQETAMAKNLEERSAQIYEAVKSLHEE